MMPVPVEGLFALQLYKKSGKFFFPSAQGDPSDIQIVSSTDEILIWLWKS